MSLKHSEIWASKITQNEIMVQIQGQISIGRIGDKIMSYTPSKSPHFTVFL